MSITTYSELQTSIATWLVRDDLTAIIPDFITLAEAKFKRDIRVREMEKRATADAVTEYTGLPSDFLEIRSAYLNTDPKQQLRVMALSEIRSRWLGSTAGQPKAFAITGDEILLAPAPDGTYEIELDYYAFSALSDSNTTNWLLTSYPDIYLWAGRLEGASYVGNEKKIVEANGFLATALKSLENSDWAATFPGPLTVIAG
ncbi:MAG: hypothetical protein GY938_10875 [Ketobacter sp.]|nr:hypothetical protein [Ketobacter sp.]